MAEKTVGKKAKDKFDELLNDYINVPLANAGYPNIGAGISAVGSAAAEMIDENIPKDAAGLAMAATPLGPVMKMGKLAKKGSKSLKSLIKKTDDAAESVAPKLKERIKRAKVDQKEAPGMQYGTKEIRDNEYLQRKIIEAKEAGRPLDVGSRRLEGADLDKALDGLRKKQAKNLETERLRQQLETRYGK